MKEYFVKSFINTSYACIENRGMHKACLDVQKAMKHCKRIWNNYYIIKMDVAKYFQNIDKEILYNILMRKIKDAKLLWLTKEILYSNGTEKGLPIGNLQANVLRNPCTNRGGNYNNNGNNNPASNRNNNNTGNANDNNGFRVSL